MNVLFVSQCSGKAIKETCRVLDQFAERCGERVWKTPITEDGLAIVARLLRRTARKNTAVACHWIRGRRISELLWIIGDRRRFNASGAVATNITSQAVLPAEDDTWLIREICRLLASMAALWHDVGKISTAFQIKLKGGPQASDVFRHEWLSLRLFQAFVGGVKEDYTWLERLAALKNAEGLSSFAKTWLSHLYKDSDDGMQINAAKPPSPFAELPPLARVIAWLILGHHRLPVKKWGQNVTKDSIIRNPLNSIVAGWGYSHVIDGKKYKKCLNETWKITEKDLPCFSHKWRERVSKIAHKLLCKQDLFSINLLDNIYLLHVSRLGLMLADHVYSSLVEPEKRTCGDATYTPYANSNRQTHTLRQKLDEHLIGVEQFSSLIFWRLTNLRETLPVVGPLSSRRFRKRSEDTRFSWQDKAFDLAASLAERSTKQGFFGVNLASTGCGKTLANGRICHALAGESGSRFTVALGLRTLKFQTGDAYCSRLKLGKDELAVLVGDEAVRELHSLKEDSETEREANDGSESHEALFQANVQFNGIPDGPLSQWFSATPGAAELVSAPVLACTIDHLVPATEGLRGGRQIAPMLRLMTSDLVLDEPDDYNVQDLYALSRLVFWAGMLGSRIILSSATITPSLAQGLFVAYQEGRKQFFRNRGNGRIMPVLCAWFDEFGCCAWFDESDCQEQEDNIEKRFATQHDKFVQARLKHLKKQNLRRQAIIWNMDGCANENDELMNFWTKRIQEAVANLHAAHHTTDVSTGKHISFGLVRMANIDPLVQTTKLLMKADLPEETHWHICCYHSHYPLLMRSTLEQHLDQLLNRKCSDDVFLSQPFVRRLLARSPAKEHVVIIFATPVAEVGRDHDYDWAIVEPSSMRSLIQLAGRVQRHRTGVPHEANIYLLDKNVKTLKSAEYPYSKPGFENKQFRLNKHDLTSLLTQEQLERLDATARVAERKKPDITTDLGQKCRLIGNLADLEHAELREVMQGSAECLLQNITLWWNGQSTMSGEVQRKSPFRVQEPTETYIWLPDEVGENCTFSRLEQNGELTSQQKMCIQEDSEIHNNVSWIEDEDYLTQLHKLAEKKDISLQTCARKFGRVDLPIRNTPWNYHACLGFFQQN